MPKLFRSAAPDALRLREQVTDRFAREESSTKPARSNASHQYFNSWFRDILAILGQTHVATQTAPSGEANTEDGNNGYASLPVQEPSIDFLMNKIILDTTSPEKGSEPEVIYSVPSTKEDMFIAIYCQYEDLNHLHKAVSEMWRPHQRGGRDLISVSIATNVAFEVAISPHAKLVEQFPDLTSCKKIFSCIATSPHGGRIYRFWKDRETNEELHIPRPFAKWSMFLAMTDLEATLWHRTAREGHLKLMAMFQAGTLWTSLSKHAETDLKNDLRSFAFIYSDVQMMRETGYRYGFHDVFTHHLCSQPYGREEGLATLTMHHVMLDVQILMESELARLFKELQVFHQYVGSLAHLHSSDTWITNFSEEMGHTFDQCQIEQMLVETAGFPKVAAERMKKNSPDRQWK